MPEMPKQETGAAIFRLRGVGKEWSGFATVAGSGTLRLVRRRARPRGLRNEKLRLSPSIRPENNSQALAFRWTSLILTGWQRLPIGIYPPPPGLIRIMGLGGNLR